MLATVFSQLTKPSNRISQEITESSAKVEKVDVGMQSEDSGTSFARENLVSRPINEGAFSSRNLGLLATLGAEAAYIYQYARNNRISRMNY